MQLIAANPQKYPISSSLKLRLLLGVRGAEPRSALSAKGLATSNSRNDKDLLRIGILNLASRGIAADVDVSAAGIEWIENETGPAWNRLGYRKLRCARGVLRGRRGLCLRFIAGNSWRCACRRATGLTGSSPRRRGWGSDGHWLARVSHVGRVPHRRRFRLVKNVPHRGSNGTRDFVRRFATNQASRHQRKRPAAPIHRTCYTSGFSSAQQSPTKRSISDSVVAHEHITR